MLTPEELSALALSAKVAGFATAVCLPFAIAVAWLLARYEFRAKFLVEAILQMPMVLPPVVLGYLLLLLFGHQGILGQYLHKWGIQLIFNWKGAVLAAMIVAFPLMVQPIRLSFQMINRQLEQVAGSLGATPWRVFCSISLPLALPGILIGSILCFSRSLGEFGAVIFIAGNIAWKTEVTSLMIFVRLQEFDYPAASAIASVILAASLLLLFSINTLQSRFGRRVVGH